MSVAIQHGYLLLADISGYTSFVARTELEHSHEILSDLLGVICEKIESLLTIHKLEGDAVFAYIPESKVTRGDTLLELVESTYVAFRDRQVSIKRATTCTCNACRNIPSLDLKFIVHHGEYILQQVRGIREMIGSDVNLIHRLLKNKVSEVTGWRAYLMLTGQCLARMQVNLEDAHIQMEEYEHVGEIKTFNVNLHQRYRELAEQRRIVVEERDADFILHVDFPTPPAVTWEWIQDPDRRNQWNGGHVHWSLGERPNGRAGVGASNHCAHGKSSSTEVMVDWRPFEYSTAESFENGKKTFTETFIFEPLPGGGTRVHDRLVMHMPMPKFIRALGLKFILINQHHMDERMQDAARMAGEEYNKNKETHEE
jgi:uncharacterized protein YndB with AHSA1/START domain